MRPYLFCAAVLATFIIDNPHCGSQSIDRKRLATMYLENGYYDQALVEGRRALREAPDQTELNLLLALAHMGNGNDMQALDILVESLADDPGNEGAHSALRTLCKKEGLRAEALRALAPLRRATDASAAVWATSAWIYLQNGQEQQAIAQLDSAIALDPTYLYARIERSHIAVEQEDFSRAESELQEALLLDADRPRLWVALGELQLRQGHVVSADSSFSRALHRDDSPHIAGHIAQLYGEQHLAEQAIPYYERALRHAPEDAQLLNNLAWTYAEAGIELERATSLSLRSLKIDGENPIYLDTYAELLYLQKRYAHAFAIIRRASEIEARNKSEYGSYLRDQYEKMRHALGPGL